MKGKNENLSIRKKTTLSNVNRQMLKTGDGHGKFEKVTGYLVFQPIVVRRTGNTLHTCSKSDELMVSDGL